MIIQLLNDGFCFRQPELYQRTGQKRCDNGADADYAAKEKADDDKENVAGDTDETELYVRQLIGDHNGDQIVGTGSGFAVDDDGHAEGENHTARDHDDSAYGNRACRIDKKRSEQPVEKVDDRSAAEGADHRSGFDIAFGGKQHNDHNQAQDDHMHRSDGGESCVCYFLTG